MISISRVWAILLLVPFFGSLGGAQTLATGPALQRPLEVTRVYNITSATQIQDNRSVTQACNVYTFTVQSGSGPAGWSVQLEYADTSPSGPWTVFGPAAILTNTTVPPVGIGTGYHNWLRLHTTAGSTTVNLSCEKDFFLPVVASGAGPFDCPTVSSSQTGCLTGPQYVALLAKQDPFYIPTATGGVAEPLRQIFANGCDGIDAAGFGAAPQNADNLINLQNALTAANTTGAGIVCLGPGTYSIGNTLDIPDKVQLRGRGRGDPGGTNTVIAANSAFPVNSPVITIGAIAGPSFTPHFGTRVSNFTVDCAQHPGCIGFSDAYGEEQSGGDHLTAINGSVCLQVLGSDLPATGRVQNEYGWHDMECFPGSAAVQTVAPVQLKNVEGGFGVDRISIVGQSGFHFNYCMEASGNSYHIESIHCEQASLAGILVGGPGTVGAPNLTINNLTMGPGSAGVPVEIYGSSFNYPSGLRINNVTRDLGGDVPVACGNVKDDYHGTCVDTPYYVLGNSRNGDSTIFDLGFGNQWTLHNPILTFNPFVTYTNGDAGENAIDLKNSTTFVGQPLLVKSNGTLDIGDGGTQGGGDLLFHNPHSKFSIDASGNNNGSGINIQGPLTPDFTDAMLFNSYYNQQNNNFTLVGDGTGYVGGLVSLNPGGPLGLATNGGGVGFVSDNSLVTPATNTPAQFALHIKTIIPGWGGIQFIRSTQPPCGIDQRGTLYFNRDSTLSTDATSICAYANGSLGWQSLGGATGGVNATSIQGVPVSAAAPTLNYVLAYDGSAWVPSVVTASTINGAAVPASAPCVGTNSSSQFISATCGTSGSSITLQTSGSNNQSQTILNLSGSGGATVTNTTAGNVVISAPAAPLFQTSGTTNASQSGLNIAVAGTLSATNSGSTVTITGTGSGLPTGAAGGDLAGNYPNPTIKAWQNASDFATVQSACAAAGATGTVLIPAAYAGTDTTWNCGTTQVIDQRNASYVQWNARQFGLTGNGATLTDGIITGGSAVLTSAGQHCFVASDVGKHIKVLDGNSTGAVSVLPGNSLIANIVSTSSCAATLSVASTGTGSLTNRKVFYGTDDSVALRNLLALIAAKPNGTATIYFPAGIYVLDGPFTNTAYIQMRGDGANATSLRQIDPTSDLLIWKAPNQAAGQPAGVAPNAFQISGNLADINLQGEGTATTGNLLVAAIASFNARNVSFSGHGGTAILMAGERNTFQNIYWRNVKRAFGTSPNFTPNETYIEDFDAMDTGCIVDSNLGNGIFYNSNANAVNGIYPGMTAAGVSDGTPGPYTLVQDPSTAFTINDATNFVMRDGSIKPTRCTGGITVTESNGQVEFSHIYTENGATNGYISPDYVAGGKHLSSVTTASITATDSFVTIQDGSHMDTFVGAQSDIPLLGSICGTLAFVYPPDFVFGSVTPSVIGGGILQGTYEQANNCGGYHDSAGWHAGIGRRTSGANSAIAWPAGAIYEQEPQLPGNAISIADSHIRSLSFDTGPRYTVVEDPNIGQTQAAVVVGFTSDLLHMWGTSLANNNSSRGVIFKGEIAMSQQYTDNAAGGTVEIHNNGYVDTHLVTNSVTGSVAQPILSGNTPISTYQLPEIKARLNRVTYAVGNRPNAAYVGPNATFQLSTSGALPPNSGYSLVANYAGTNGPLMQYQQHFAFGDAVNGTSVKPNDLLQIQGDSTGSPGLQYQVYSPTADNNASVFNIIASTQAQLAAGQPRSATFSLNDGAGNTATAAVMSNALQLLTIKNVNAPAVTPTGGAAGSYSYTVTACAVDGTCTAGANVTTIANGPTTLSGTTFNSVSWAAPAGVPAYYNVYRTSGGLSTGLINAAPILAGTTSLVDTGQTGTGSAPAQNNTGALLSSSSTTQLPAGHLEVDGDVSNVLIRGDGTLALIPTGTQPTCAVSERGSFWYIQAAAGTADTIQTCSKNAANAYAWTTVGTGGGGGGTPGGASNAVQYNSGGTFGGIINSTATQQFLSQTSSGLPAFASLTTANLPTAIPLANLATIATGTVLGNNSGATAIPTALTAAALNVILGGAPATSTTFGVVKCDGITITCASGVLSSSHDNFGQVTAGTNTSTLTMGAGGILTVAGGGIINATQVNGANLPASAACTGTNATGQLVAVSCGGAGGGGTVTNVAFAAPTWLTVAGSPITTTGTITLSPAAAQASHQVIGTCGTATTFVPCALVPGDIPTLNQNTTGTASNITGLLAVINGGTGTTTPSLVAGTNVTITGTWPNQTVTASGAGGGSTTTTINGGTPCTITGANCNLQIPVPVAGSGVSIVNAGSGNGQTATFAASAPVDIQVSNGGGYSPPAADCTATGGTLIVTGTQSMSIGIAQAGLGGNWGGGCKLNVINESTGPVTISFSVSTWNTASGTNAIVLAARSGSTARRVLIISDASNYVGTQQ